ncbi:MAG: DNA primase [Geothermobacteraceae bacterium]
MGRIPEETIQQIRDRVDIVELVGRYVQLKRSGVNNFGLCPFHGEKTPSFNVNADRQSFHCFGCGEGGNAISFLMKIEGLGFREAVEKLAAEVGVEIAEERTSPEEEARRRERERLQRINVEACHFYHRLLMRDNCAGQARAYLKKRGFDGDDARAWQLGYAPDAWDRLAGYLAEKGIEAGPARQLGLVRPGKQGRGDYDLFRDRLIFPIEDHYGNVVAFGGRALKDDGPKYINSPESPIYHKGRVLYGLFAGREMMRKSRCAVVVEGYFDVLAMHRAGWKNTVATCGTAMTRDHARLLKRYADTLILLFDQDSAGQAAVVRGLEAALPEGLEVRTLSLDPGEDPDSFLARYGREELERRIDNAVPALEWDMDRLLGEASDIRSRARAIDELAGRISLVADPIERDLYIRGLAERTGLDAATLSGPARSDRHPSGIEQRTQAVEVAPAPQRDSAAGGLHPAEELLLHLLAVDSVAREQAAGVDLEEVFMHSAALELARELVNLPQETGDPLAVLSLNDGQRRILSGILEKDRARLGEEPDAMLAECCRRLKTERLRRRDRELSRLIAEAEKNGDQAARNDLLREKQDISRRLKAGLT